MLSVDAIIYTDWPEALKRLNRMLPLAARQAALAPPLRAVHRRILAGFAQSGHPPRASELDGSIGGVALSDALAQLKALDLVVLDRLGAVIGAYPFTLEQTPHRVAFDDVEVKAMCAIDALAVGPMTGRATTVRSRCHHCGTPITLEQRDETIAPPTVAREMRVGIAWHDPGVCAAHSLCREMVFFCSPVHARDWQARNESLHCLMQPAHAIALAKAFFLPLLG